MGVEQPVGPAGVALGVAEHADEDHGEGDPHHEGLLECHQAAGELLVGVGREAPEAGLVGVEGVEGVRREDEDQAEDSDGELGRRHVDGRAHPAEPVAAADRREQMPPVEAAGDGVGEVLEDVDEGVAQGRVVERREMPDPDGGDVEDDGERRPAEPAGRLLESDQAAGCRAEDQLRLAADQEDRGDVEEQDVLDHVDEEEVVGDAVDRRDQGPEDREQAGEERGQAPASGSPSPVLGTDPPPAGDVQPEGGGDRDQHDRLRRPRDVGAHAGDCRLTAAARRACLRDGRPQARTSPRRLARGRIAGPSAGGWRAGWRAEPGR